MRLASSGKYAILLNKDFIIIITENLYYYYYYYYTTLSWSASRWIGFITEISKEIKTADTHLCMNRFSFLN